MGDETKRRKNGRRSEGGSWSCWRNESGFGRRKNYGGRNWTESKIQIRTCKKKEVFNSCVAVASDEGKERTRNGRVVKKKEKKLGDREVSFQQLVDIEGEEFELFHKKPSENREEASLSFAVFCLFLLLNRVLIFFPVLVSKKCWFYRFFQVLPFFCVFLCLVFTSLPRVIRNNRVGVFFVNVLFSIFAVFLCGGLCFAGFFVSFFFLELVQTSTADLSLPWVEPMRRRQQPEQPAA